MKKPSAGSPYTKFIAAASAFVWTIAIATSARGAQLQEARVTQVVNDVKLLREQGAPRPAVVSDFVRRGNAVRTGTQSRSELTFADLTITRLGANTIFSFKEGTREMNLIDGAILFQVPKGSGGATIRTVGVTAAITGTTGIAEFHPATASRPQPFSKWLCLEGTFHLYLPNGQSMELGPGKMVTTDSKSFSKVATFNIAKLASTSLFFTGFDKPLASLDLIIMEEQQQIAVASTTRNPLDPTRIANVINQASVAEETPTPSTTPPVTPTPSTTPPVTPTPPTKFGTPAVIASPNPYLITSGTTITTDPSITTNGVTDFGKIYRGQTDDGAFSLWAFGSTSAFDTALRIDDVDPNVLPIAVFKFQSLSLTGDPTIHTTNGATKLGLIGVDGITSGPPGGTLKFTGLDLLILATVNGSINLTSDVSFQDLNGLAMYARGAGSDLTINSPISNIGSLALVAEDSIHLTNPGTMSVGTLGAITGGDLVLQIGGSLLLNGRVRLHAIVLPGASVANGANLTLNVAGDYTNNSAAESSRLAIMNRDHIGTGGNIDVSIGGNLTAMNDFSLVVQNTNGQIDNGGNLNLAVGGATSITNLDAGIDNSNGGTIDNGGNVTLHTVGPVMLDGGFSLETVNFDGGTMNDGGNVMAHFVGDVTATIGDFHSFNFFVVNGGNDFVGDLGGGTIGTGGNIDATFDGNAATTPTATSGSFAAEIANDHGNIGTGGNISVAIGGNLTCGPLFVYTSNRYGGQIGTGGNVTLDVAGNVSSADQAFLGVVNNGGSIGSGINVTLNVGGDLSTQAGAFFQILNNDDGIGSGPGTIGSNATINVGAGSISAGGAFDAEIDNLNGGDIGGNALVNVGVSNDINIVGDTTFQVLNSGGTIGGAAEINVNAANISIDGNLDAEIDNFASGTIAHNTAVSFTTSGDLTAGSILAFINNRDGGSIGSGGEVDFNIGGALTTQDDATFAISNRNDSAGGGMIGGDVDLILSAANVSVGGYLLTDISANRGGHIIGSASNMVVTAGTLSGGTLDFEIENAGFDNGGGFASGGTIDSDAIINVSAGNISTTADYLNAVIANDGGGHIGGSTVINVFASSGINAGTDAFFTILNGQNGEGTPAGTIGGDATINVNTGGTSSVAGSLLSEIDNTQGSIGGNATINMNVSGNANVTTDATVAIYGSDGAKSSAININGGNYNVGGTFLTYIDGNGTIAFNNASAHADVLKAGVFGANGVLNIGGGTLSADTTLKLYAPGSNGQLNFISNVTLGGNSAKILAANSVTIFNNVVVTIGGSKPADVYTGFTDEIPNANYTGFGGNGSTTGTFGGAGANDPQPIENAPPFDNTNRVTSSSKRSGGGRPTNTKINVSSSDELLALLDDATPGPGGKITVRNSKPTNHSKDANRIGAANRLNAASRRNADRRPVDMRTASSSLPRRLMP